MRHFIVLTLCLNALAASRHDSGIRGPKWSEHLMQMSQLEAGYPRMVNLRDYGTSVKGRVLRLLIAKSEKTFSGKRAAIIMTGSIHGNEYLNIEDRLPEELLKQASVRSSVREFLEKGGVFIFVPIINPDGYDLRLRGNAKKVNLNRDWPLKAAGFIGLSQPETVYLHSQIEELVRELNLEIKLNVDYHCCAGGTLYPWGFKATPMPASDLKRHQSFALMAQKYLGTRYGTVAQILGYRPLGTTLDHYYETYGAISLTFEGRKKKEKNFLKEHLHWWDDMIAAVNKQM